MWVARRSRLCLRIVSGRQVRQLSGKPPDLDSLTQYSVHVPPCSDTDTKLPKPSDDTLKNLINQFSARDILRELAAEQGVSPKMFSICAERFLEYLQSSKHLPAETGYLINDILEGKSHVDELFPYFLAHCKKVFPIIDCVEDLARISDLTDPASWYPRARQMKRRIVYHSGPTNSGKTHHATHAFFTSHSAVYCSPLRLLASEVYHKTVERGIQCDLITGEEKILAHGDESSASHTACTVEMLDINKEYDVVVIDEIQLLRDESRGHAWTRALLGVPARELHLCGEPAALDLVRRMAASCGEEVQVATYDRLTPLCFEDRALETWDRVQKGDCIIAFSKNQIFSICAELDSRRLKYAVIYGALPPRTKLDQARKFNNPDSGVDILVASDAIGMGINLSIRRIIFSSMTKVSVVNDVREQSVLPPHLALQIAGRAGRFGTQYDMGFVTCFHPEDMKILKAIKKETPKAVEKAGIGPTFEQIELFSYQLPELSLVNLLNVFRCLAELDVLYFACEDSDFKAIAELLAPVSLPLAAKYKFCLSPANVEHSLIATALTRYARSYSRGVTVRAEDVKRIIKWHALDQPRNREALAHLEVVHDALDLYLWLSHRFPLVFNDAVRVQTVRDQVADLLSAGLENLKRLPLSHSDGGQPRVSARQHKVKSTVRSIIQSAAAASVNNNLHVASTCIPSAGQPEEDSPGEGSPGGFGEMENAVPAPVADEAISAGESEPCEEDSDVDYSSQPKSFPKIPREFTTAQAGSRIQSGEWQRAIREYLACYLQDESPPSRDSRERSSTR